MLEDELSLEGNTKSKVPLCRKCLQRPVEPQSKRFKNKTYSKLCSVCRKESKVKATEKAIAKRKLEKKSPKLSQGGYPLVPVHETRLRAEHKIVMEQILGRPLRKGEAVHHINGNRTDNRPENLELWVRTHPSGVRARDLVCPHCGKSYLDQPLLK